MNLDTGQKILQRLDSRNRVLIVMAGAFLTAVFIVVSLTGYGVYSQGRQLVDIARQNKATGELLIDCTTPSIPGEQHECWDRLRSGDNGTSDAVRRLNCLPLVLAGYRPDECGDVVKVVEGLPRA